MKYFFIAIAYVLAFCALVTWLVITQSTPLDRSVTLRVASLSGADVYQINIDGVDYLVNSRGGIIKK
jgi:hypothetical protein